MSKAQTIRGETSNLRYIEKTGRQLSYTQDPEKAATITFEVGGRVVSAMNSDLPTISEGDDVEVTGVVNARGGMEVVQLHNHTTGADWKFNVFSTARRSFFKGG